MVEIHSRCEFDAAHFGVNGGVLEGLLNMPKKFILGSAKKKSEIETIFFTLVSLGKINEKIPNDKVSLFVVTLQTLFLVRKVTTVSLCPFVCLVFILVQCLGETGKSLSSAVLKFFQPEF